MYPSITHHLNIIQWVKIFKQRYCKLIHIVLNYSVFGLDIYELRIQDILAVTIIDENPERLGRPMDFFIPFEINFDC